MAGSKVSAGLLMYRRKNDEPEVFLVHPGGPFFKNKDEGHWSIPKGELHDSENLLKAGIREFIEETGIKPPENTVYCELGSTVNPSGKTIYAWGWKSGLTDTELAGVFKSNTFTLEWPPKSGKFQEFPENDRGQFFSLEEASRKIHPTQKIFLTRLNNFLFPLRS